MLIHPKSVELVEPGAKITAVPFVIPSTPTAYVLPPPALTSDSPAPSLPTPASPPSPT